MINSPPPPPSPQPPQQMRSINNAFQPLASELLDQYINAASRAQAAARIAWILAADHASLNVRFAPQPSTPPPPPNPPHPHQDQTIHNVQLHQIPPPPPPVYHHYRHYPYSFHSEEDNCTPCCHRRQQRWQPLSPACSTHPSTLPLDQGQIIDNAHYSYTTNTPRPSSSCGITGYSCCCCCCWKEGHFSCFREATATSDLTNNNRRSIRESKLFRGPFISSCNIRSSNSSSVQREMTGRREHRPAAPPLGANIIGTRKKSHFPSGGRRCRLDGGRHMQQHMGWQWRPVQLPSTSSCTPACSTASDSTSLETNNTTNDLINDDFVLECSSTLFNEVEATATSATTSSTKNTRGGSSTSAGVCVVGTAGDDANLGHVHTPDISDHESGGSSNSSIGCGEGQLTWSVGAAAPEAACSRDEAQLGMDAVEEEGSIRCFVGGGSAAGVVIPAALPTTATCTAAESAGASDGNAAGCAWSSSSCSSTSAAAPCPAGAGAKLLNDHISVNGEEKYSNTTSTSATTTTTSSSSSSSSTSSSKNHKKHLKKKKLKQQQQQLVITSINVDAWE